MKGKGTMIITIGAMIALLVCVMLMQFRTVEETDITTLETMREAELRTEIASWKTKYEETSKRLAEVQTSIQEYNEKMTNNQEASELLKQELEQANVRLGKTEVTGSGVIITLQDNLYACIDAYDIYKLVNELRLAGAEAISVNEIRITATTDIKDIKQDNTKMVGLIMINGDPVVSPYIIKAIGEQTHLESALTLKDFGYIDSIIKPDKTATLEKSDNIRIPAINKELKLEYAEEVKQ